MMKELLPAVGAMFAAATMLVETRPVRKIPLTIAVASQVALVAAAGENFV